VEEEEEEEEESEPPPSEAPAAPVAENGAPDPNAPPAAGPVRKKRGRKSKQELLALALSNPEKPPERPKKDKNKEIGENGEVKITMASFIRQLPDGNAMPSTIERRQSKKTAKKVTADPTDATEKEQQPQPEIEAGEPGAVPDPLLESLTQDNGPRLDETAFAPQVMIVDGKIVLDETSLFLPTPAAAEYEDEVLVETGSHVTSSSYIHRTGADKWTQEETDLFFQGLSYWGTDFDLISKMFKKRDRRQIKNKFKREERANPTLVQQALVNRKIMPPGMFEMT